MAKGKRHKTTENAFIFLSQCRMRQDNNVSLIKTFTWSTWSAAFLLLICIGAEIKSFPPQGRAL